MQQVMAMQAEAIRENARAIIKAEAELEASEKLSAASAGWPEIRRPWNCAVCKWSPKWARRTTAPRSL